MTDVISCSAKMMTRTSLLVLVAVIVQAAAAVAFERPWFCHGLDCPEYKVVDRYGDDKEVVLRQYYAGNWTSTIVEETSYDKAVYRGFKRLFKYISGDNEEDLKIAMTAPVRVKVHPGDGPTCASKFTVSFFVPFKYQDSPPVPNDEAVFTEEIDKSEVFVYSYSGFTYEKKVISMAKLLTDKLDSLDLEYDADVFYAAGYDPPFRLLNRHNEIWIPAKNKKHGTGGPQ